jgi:DNA-binding IclR family transcriptional regulator
MSDVGVAPPHSQTLSRGIRVLEALADASTPMTIAQLSTVLDVHRSIAYRILRTLEDHGLVGRDAAGAFALAPKMATLALGVERDLQSAALPELTALASDLALTAFLVVLDNLECVTLASVEPRTGGATVAQRPGTRHLLGVGAPGIAIQSLLTDAELARRGVARRPLVDGIATSHDEVILGLRAVAVPLKASGIPPAAVAVVFVSSPHDEDEIGSRLQVAAATIARDLGSH